MLCSVNEVYFILRRNWALQSLIHTYFTLRGKKTLLQSVIEPYSAPKREPVLNSTIQDLDNNAIEQEVQLRYNWIYVFVTSRCFFSPLRESDKLLPEFPSALNRHCHIAEDMRSHFHIHRWESLSFSRDDCWRVPSTKSFPCTQTTLLLPKWISSTHISYFPHFNLMFRVSYIYPTPVTFLIRRLLLPSLFILFPSRKWHLDVVNTARWN